MAFGVVQIEGRSTKAEHLIQSGPRFRRRLLSVRRHRRGLREHLTHKSRQVGAGVCWLIDSDIFRHIFPLHIILSYSNFFITLDLMRILFVITGIIKFCKARAAQQFTFLVLDGSCPRPGLGDLFGDGGGPVG